MGEMAFALGRRQIRLAGWLICLVCLVVTLPAVPAAAAAPYISSFGPDGTEASDFGAVGSVAVDQLTGAIYVADKEAGALYKFGPSGEAVNFSGSAPYISGNEITGVSYFGGLGESQIAVDSETHIIYVTSENKVRAFDQSGEPAEFTAGPGMGTNEIPDFEELLGVAVDSDGNIYASDFRAEKVKIYSRSGQAITTFTSSGPANLAIGPDGSVYVAKWLGAVRKYTPSDRPVASTTAFAEPTNPLDEHWAFSVAADPVTGYAYIPERYPDGSEEARIAVYSETGDLAATFGKPGEEGALKSFAPGIAVNGTNAKFYVSNDDLSGEPYSKVEIFEAVSIPVLPPTVVATSANSVTSDSAVLSARINPNTLATTYRFEYGLEDCSVASNCNSIPLLGASIGAGHLPVAVAQEIAGLAANTSYYFRVVAENSLGVTEGPVRTFTTQTGTGDFILSDHRVWEQVSPQHKLGGSIILSGLAITQAAADGEGVVFATHGSIEAEPEGNRTLEPSTVLARRDGDSWSSKDIIPRHTEAAGVGFGSEYKVFNPDLSLALLEPRDETQLSVEASERTPYLRDNGSPPVYFPLVTSKEGYANVPPGTVFGGEANGSRNPVAVAGANKSLSHVVVVSKEPLVSGGGKGALYLWSEGVLRAVSELPPAEGGEIVLAELGSGKGSTRNAVSSDGSRVFWSPGEAYTLSGIGTLALYVRDTGAEESARLDVVQPGATGAGEPHPAFQGASADGSVVFFTDSQQLTTDASPEGRDLYRCALGNVGGSLGCETLTDISVSNGGGESADVRDVIVGLSDDGTQIYFVADGILDGNSSSEGESATAGEPNLYAWSQSNGIRFVATLDSDDATDWGVGVGAIYGYTAEKSATVSPSGRYVVFMSKRSLIGYDNQDPRNGEALEEAYTYDAFTDKVVCLSCNPSGGSNAGMKMSRDLFAGVTTDPRNLWNGKWVAATLPEAAESEPFSYSFYWPRAVLDNGRAFFNSMGSLVPADSNGAWDVYQYEPFGVGDCTKLSGDAGQVQSGDGCVSLISSGAAERPSAFLDASQNGDDVFFLSSGQLSALDQDSEVDVYDARVDGKATVLNPQSECLGQACQSSPGRPPDPAVNSMRFSGPGNVPKRSKPRCRNGQRKARVRGKIRCVGKKHHRHQKAKGAAQGGKGK